MGIEERGRPVQVGDHQGDLVHHEGLLVFLLNVLDLLVDPGEVGDPDLGLCGADLQPLEHNLVLLDERDLVKVHLQVQRFGTFTQIGFLLISFTNVVHVNTMV